MISKCFDGLDLPRGPASAAAEAAAAGGGGGAGAGVGVAPEPDPDHGAGGGLPRPGLARLPRSPITRPSQVKWV